MKTPLNLTQKDSKEEPPKSDSGIDFTKSSYDFEVNRIFEKIDEIREQKHQRGDFSPIFVGLQFPEGLKKHAVELAFLIEKKTDATVFISADPCFGACDLDAHLISKTDILFHFGHAQLEETDLEKKVCFIETRSKVNVKPAVLAAIPLLSEKKIGLVTTVQHAHQLEEIKSILESAGKSAVIAKGDRRTPYSGQVLGCNFSAAHSPDSDCDAYLFIGSGRFHPIGVALSSKKRVVCADPFLSEAFELDFRKFLMQRSAVIGNSKEAETFGIIVSTKNGQCREKLAESLKEKAKAHGKEAVILHMDLVTPDQMLNFPVDAFVNTACPRLAIDDSGRYPVPVLTPQEFEIVLGERDWEDLVLDEILEGERE
ncbi:diphthamide biosynthesis enzyme Dph2 [Methanolapillus millepedarum]|uniref:2-(3-amino-3-carboxypropyl)histidine synthase n=1 Tax=Methanolapillus millepedarum TaxID=3028296 RepID=A0AA96ZU80_9EURY|nr:hypothetical protein MsAc7_09040 [Methanosarcinaceae archaeon Ac7]